ncbi:MAG: Asp-tRNA(Asn)/Glu-tRNA(Gln) amidotransferase subunit GatC [Actinobacteria bacterium]|nr:Asp-tRNA(Asn)/Glu-tRNA(Gln) amidotransferase subunit GatC [Actinomycetota bacterium]
MSEITSDLVRHLAGLARIDLNEDEVARFTEQLSLIVDSVAKISNAIDANTPVTSHPIPLANVFREDVVKPSLTQEQALSGAPDSGQGRFRVAAILDEE